MRAPCEFKYSPHGYDIKIVHAGDEMSADEQAIAISLGLMPAPDVEAVEVGESAASVESTPSLLGNISGWFGRKGSRPAANKAAQPALNKRTG